MRAVSGLPVPRCPEKCSRARCGLPDGIPQCGDDVLLVQEIVKRLGPVFAGNDLVHGRGINYARLRVIRHGTRE